MNTVKVNMEITEREKKLIDKLRQIPFGKVTIFMQDGSPVRIERIEESQIL